MADVAFATQGNSGTSTKQDSGALLRISHALCGLVGSLISSLEEFRDVGNTLELEIAAGIANGSPESESVEARAELLLVVAATLKEMVGTLVSDMKANAEVQKLLPAIQKSSGANHHALHGLFQDLMISKQPDDLPSCLVDISPPSEEMPVCISNKDSRTAKRSAGKGQVMCTHVCAHHPELVNPGLWRKLPQELVELVFAKLPLPHIIELCESSKAWSTLSKSSNFREACSEEHPKLFGLVGFDSHFESTWTRIHDIKSKEWLCVELADFPGSFGYQHDVYRNTIYSCDGGLACFVSLEHFSSSPILVCNPLTSTWKALPLLPLDDSENKKIIMAQLLMEDDRKCYRVILVSQDKIGEAFSAHVYNSKTGMWSIMDSGLVHGVDSELLYGNGIPYVFDCTTKTLFDLRQCASLGSLDAVSAYSVAKDRVFVLHESEVPGQRGHFMYLVSEYTWESSISDLRELNVSESPVQIWPDPYKVILFASPSFVLVFADNCEEWHEDHHQLIGRYDVSANQWDIPPPVPYGDNIHHEPLMSLFICELRWNISP